MIGGQGGRGGFIVHDGGGSIAPGGGGPLCLRINYVNVPLLTIEGILKQATHGGYIPGGRFQRKPLFSPFRQNCIQSIKRLKEKL